MAITKTSICNGALLLLGQEPSLNDVDLDPSVFAGDLKLAWDVVVDAALRDHPWNFAMYHAKLGNDADAPAWGFGKQYTRPSDPWCLRVWGFSRDHHGENPKFIVRADRKIWTDEGSPIYTKHIVRVTNPALFDPNFVEYLELKLAWKTAYKITGSRAAQRELQEMMKGFRPAAASIDGQEGGEEEDADQGEFLESRSIG